MLDDGFTFLCGLHPERKMSREKNVQKSRDILQLVGEWPPEGSLHPIHKNTAESKKHLGVLNVFAQPKCVPGEAHSSAGAVGVTQDASGDGLAEGLQHVLQLLFVHRQGQVGDVQVGRILLLLLQVDSGWVSEWGAI